MYRSTMMSNLLDYIIFVQNGIDQVRRNITMHIDEDNNGGSFVDLDDSVKSRARLEGYKKEQPIIETALLGDLLKATMAHDKPKRIVVKMDIEGFECRAILGKKYIKRYCLITIEVFLYIYLGPPKIFKSSFLYLRLKRYFQTISYHSCGNGMVFQS